MLELGRYWFAGWACSHWDLHHRITRETDVDVVAAVADVSVAGDLLSLLKAKEGPSARVSRLMAMVERFGGTAPAPASGVGGAQP